MNINGVASALSQRENYKWLAFAAIALGTLTSVINNGSMIVAVPTIAQHFGTDLATVQWVVIAEGLTVSALLLPMGRLSDVIGRKRVYITGLVIFVIAAAIAGASGNIAMLIGFKAMQGIGAAMTQGTSMAMITTIFRTSERGKAIGMNASVVGTGGVIGPVAGGLLVSTLGWQWVFHVNVIMGLIAMTTVFVVIDSSMFRQSGRKVSYDWLGAGLSTSTLLAFLLTVTNGARLGWTTTPIFAGAIAFAVLLAAFIWWELRAPSPMLDLNLFKNRVFSLGVATGFVSFLGITSVRFLLPFFLQAAMGMNPGQVGLMMIPNAVSRIVMGPISGRLSDKYGWRTFNVLGLTMTAVGLFVFATLTETSSLFMVVVGIVLQSSGSGIFQSPNSSSIFSAADQSRHGVVSALVNLSRNSANVTGVAVATAIVTGVMLSMGYVTDIDSVVNAGPGTAIVHSFVTGLRVTYLIMGSITLLGAVASFFKGPQPTVTLEESQPQGSGVRG